MIDVFEICNYSKRDLLRNSAILLMIFDYAMVNVKSREKFSIVYFDINLQPYTFVMNLFNKISRLPIIYLGLKY